MAKKVVSTVKKVAAKVVNTVKKVVTAVQKTVVNTSNATAKNVTNLFKQTSTSNKSAVNGKTQTSKQGSSKFYGTIKSKPTNVVSVGGRLVSKFEMKSCTTSARMEKQSTAGQAVVGGAVFTPEIAKVVLTVLGLVATYVVVKNSLDNAPITYGTPNIRIELKEIPSYTSAYSPKALGTTRSEAKEGTSGAAKAIQAQDVDINNLPEGWTRTDNNGRTHVRDGNGKIRVRIDPPDSKTDYRHRHNYDEDGNSLDKDGNVVDKKGPDGYVPYDGD